jgi:type II secretory pathway pseudopilin PulG
MRTPTSRNGFALIVVVVLTALTAGLLSMLSLWAAYRYREVQSERARQVARAIGDSAVAYARSHLNEWKSAPPADRLVLDVSSLAPAGMSASASVVFVIEDGRRVCRVSSRAERGAIASEDTVDLPLGPAPATSSAPAVEKAAPDTP